MLKTKDNFKGMFKDKTCRMCGKTEETQTHILETCAAKYHTTTNIRVTNTEIFSNNLTILRNAARKVKIITEELEKIEKLHKPT